MQIHGRGRDRAALGVAQYAHGAGRVCPVDRAELAATGRAKGGPDRGRYDAGRGLLTTEADVGDPVCKAGRIAAHVADLADAADRLSGCGRSVKTGGRLGHGGGLFGILGGLAGGGLLFGSR